MSLGAWPTIGAPHGAGAREAGSSRALKPMANQPVDLQAAHKRQKKRESLLETLESIVVAFILAFVFRAFIVEAFVIPTGSMAATLNGAHLEFTCPDCGYEFSMGYETGRPGQAYCPNCGLAQPGGERPSVYSGDRILVLKFLYDFTQPERWDVVVFRNPNTPSQNYIKRLVGLPGETVELADGDVTIDGRIVRKPDKAQEALWMVVHDTAYRPTRSGWASRWTGEEGWRSDGPGFQGTPSGDRVAWLTYEHRDFDGRRANITDVYGYNTADPQFRNGRYVCGDLCLRGDVKARDARTVLVVELWAYRDRFRFELPAEGGEGVARIVRLVERDGRTDERVLARSAGGVLPVGRSVAVQAANVDEKVMLLVDGRRVAEVAAGAATSEGDAIYRPTPVASGARRAMASELGRASGVRVGVRGGGVDIASLRLDRDVYYTGTTEPAHAVEGRPFALREDEYFVLGDNSPKSFDCRLWQLERPVVPRRNLVGKAFFVYWPAAGERYATPLAPDVTAWRFVH